jgi:hypothetical protein
MRFLNLKSLASILRSPHKSQHLSPSPTRPLSRFLFASLPPCRRWAHHPAKQEETQTLTAPPLLAPLQVVGHTIQRSIDSACEGQVYRIDVGMSKVGVRLKSDVGMSKVGGR